MVFLQIALCVYIWPIPIVLSVLCVRGGKRGGEEMVATDGYLRYSH